MSLQIAANHLASKGRGPDSQLVHMAPTEVAGLQALAKAHGGSLTINPETGLPEAGFLSNMLPMVIGAGLSVASGGTLTPMMAGLMTGAGYGLIKGDLKAGLMAGLGAYGGAGMMGSVLGAGAEAAATAGMQSSQAAATTVPTAAQTAGMNQAFEQSLASRAVPSTGLGGTGAAMSAADANIAYAPQQFAANAQQAAANAAPVTPMPTQVELNQQIGQRLSDAATAARDRYMNNTGFMDQMKGGLGSIAQNPSQFFSKDNLKYMLAGAIPGMLEAPKMASYTPDTEQAVYTYSPGRTEKPEYLTSETATPANSYERQWFAPSYTRVMASGGPVSDMSARNEGLMLLANGGQQFAEGGGVSSYTFDPATQKYNKAASAEQAPSALSQLSHGNQIMYGLMMSGLGGFGSMTGDAIARKLLARQNAANPTSQYVFDPKTQQYTQAMANGGPVGAVDPIFSTTTQQPDLQQYTYDPMKKQYAKVVPPAVQAQAAVAQQLDQGGGGVGSVAGQGYGGFGPSDTSYSGYSDAMAAAGQNSGVAVESMGTSAGYDGSAVGGGYSDGSDGGYWANGGAIPAAKGRFLRGPGDGVSDSIPATIGGNQPARLADGEFVVPARIVSELGNGSSEAGARKLYAMMDRVQKARRKTVGKNKVATDSKAEKMLPA